MHLTGGEGEVFALSLGSLVWYGNAMAWKGWESHVRVPLFGLWGACVCIR